MDESLIPLRRRISFLFGLKGPCVAVETGCSSSLVAAHYATADLISGVSLAALAAGVSLLLTPQRSASFTVNGEYLATRPNTLDHMKSPNGLSIGCVAQSCRHARR